MTMFKGKAIYNPSGKAGEYSEWACNFHIGCSNDCTYCYLKKGRSAKVLGGIEPKLKKCFTNETHALMTFKIELLKNLAEIKNHGLFFTFTSDPLLEETRDLTMKAVVFCNENNVPVKLLTKRADIVNLIEAFADKHRLNRSLIAVGFTLTGHNELEPSASTNEHRICTMETLKAYGYRTFASIEPIIDFKSSLEIIETTKGFCNLFKIGLESGKKYDKKEALEFYVKVNLMLSCRSEAKAYWKDSFLKLLKTNRETCLANFYSTVGRDYNLFE